MTKYVIKRKIPRYRQAGEVGAYALGGSGGIQGLGAEPMSSTSPAMPVSSIAGVLGTDAAFGSLPSPGMMEARYANVFPDADPSGMVSPDDPYGALRGKSVEGLSSDTSGIYADVLNESIAPIEPNKSKNEAGETNTYDFTPVTYYGGNDMASRFAQMGRGIGRMTSDGYGDLSGGTKAANTISTIMSGVGGILGTARSVFSGIAAGQGERQNERLAAERLAKQRRRSQIQYRAGGVYLGQGRSMGVESLTGEYMYPLPKSMERRANVEVERGEYVERPGDTPKEVLGEKHEKGGTPVSVEERTKVISDDTKIEPEFAKYVRETYGIKATPKDTYATLMDRYKAKIGLKAAYEDQEKALRRLEKNKDIEDENTRRLNDSVISKAISDCEETINGLEGRFTDFANVIYKEQEDQKMRRDETTYFKEGGEVSRRIAEAKKKYGLSDDDIEAAKRKLLSMVADIRQRMDDGGSALFGRKLRFRPIANRFNNDQNFFGYQRQTSGDSYGGVEGNDWRSEMERLNPTALAAYDAADTDKALAMQKAYHKNAGAWTNLATADNSIIDNADALRDYAALVNFNGEDSAGNYPEDNEGSYHDRMLDNKLGKFTTSRPTIGLDIATLSQQRELEKAGITHFSQLFSDENKDKAAKILGDDYLKMQAMRSMPGMEGLDFVIDAYTPELDGKVSGVDVKAPTPDLSPISDKISTAAPVTTPAVDDKGNIQEPKRGNRGNIAGGFLAFPEVFRMAPSPVTTEGLERHYAPRMDPALRSPDQYMTEIGRTMSAQLDQMGAVPDSQRGALMSNLQAIAGSNIGRHINEVEESNIRQRTYADNYNQRSWKEADDQNIAERLRYQSGMLQGQAINEENWNRYFDSVNDEIQQKWNAAMSMNTLRSIFGDVAIGPNGELIARPQGDIVSPRRFFVDPATDGRTSKKG